MSVRAGNRKRLILFTSSFPFGSGETFLAEEFPYLERAFEEIRIVSNDTSSPQNWEVGLSVKVKRVADRLTLREKVLALSAAFEPLVAAEIRRLQERHPTATALRVRAIVLASWFRARRYARLIREIRYEDPDVPLVGYSYWASDAAIAVAIARRQGLLHRAISRAHGWDVYSDRDEVGVLPFRDMLAEDLDHLCFVAEDGRRYFERKVQISSPKLRVETLGTRQQACEPLARGELDTIVSCSSLIPLKRVNLLVEALMRCDRPLRWLHIGDGPERDRIETASRDLPAHVSARVEGQVRHQEVAVHLRDARPMALISVSRSEGLPVSMMEAMALGVPVIGTRVGGVPEIVTDSVNGVLLPATPSPDEVWAGIVRVRDLSPARQQETSRMAWTTWNERFRADVNFPRMAALLSGIAA